MTFWVIVTLLLIGAAGALAWPILRGRGYNVETAAYDVEVYRGQLKQLEAELEAGLIGKAEADAARAEIGRRMLAADARRDTETGDRPALRGAFALTAAMALLTPIGAVVLYAQLGSPGMPAFPFAEREQRNAGETADMQAIATRLARRLAEDQGNLDGWLLLARTYTALRQYTEASTAYEKALGLDAGNAEIVSAYGETLALAAGGTVTPAARSAFDAALKKSPREPRALFYLALAEEQEGNTRTALDRWVDLLKDAPAEAPWTHIARDRAAKAATSLGLDPEKTLPPPPVARGPSQEDLAAARAMTPEQRQSMIESMVASLADRMKDDPDNLEGWVRLGRSYAVLRRHGKARDAIKQAVRLAPENIDILLLYGRSLRSFSGDKQTPESVAVMRRVLALDANNIEGLWLVGRAEVNDGDRAAGIEKMQRALDRMPKDAPQRAGLQAYLADLKAGKK